MRRLTVKPIVFKGCMTPKKLKRYAKDPNVFAMYNVHRTVKAMYERINNQNCPPYEECYKTRPLKIIYDRAIENDSAIGFNLEALCYRIDYGDLVIFRVKELYA